VGDADFVVVVVGLTSADEGEEYTGAADRETLEIPLQWAQSDYQTIDEVPKGRAKDVDQNKLVRDVLALGKPTVVVIESGGVIDADWLGTAPAVVMAWYGGQRGGEALGRLLFGQTNFAGRLPVTWPQTLDQFPTFTRGKTEPNPMEFNIGYRYFDEKDLTPRYAFGHGLSYTTFKYEALNVGCGEVSANGIIQVDVDVRNAGDRDGDEVVQVYVSHPGSKERRPEKELRGFARVNLKKGEAKTVRIPVRVRDLKVWDTDTHDWIIEEGPVEIRVGGSSDKLFGPQTVQVHAPAAQ
jgi:beta-glucosidase